MNCLLSVAVYVNETAETRANLLRIDVGAAAANQRLIRREGADICDSVDETLLQSLFAAQAGAEAHAPEAILNLPPVNRVERDLPECVRLVADQARARQHGHNLFIVPALLNEQRFV